MTFWLITDTHLGHKNMVKTCGRPENFDRLILDSWRKLVKNNDTIIHLGDVAWTDEYLRKISHLPGQKILLLGNHDKRNMVAYMKAGFELVCEELVLRLDGMHVLLTHYPKYGHTYDINIHGHQHDLHRASDKELYLPLALEAQGYAPIEVSPEFLKTLHGWVDNFKLSGKVPSTEEIRDLGPEPIEMLRQRDYYGSRNVEEEE